jgi:hypothetical protein
VVLYVAPGKKLHRVDFPEKSPPGERAWEDATGFTPCSFRAVVEDTLPESLPNPDGRWDVSYSKLREELGGIFPKQANWSEPDMHRLLGWPDLLQNDMREELQQLFPRGSDWMLLLQVDSPRDDRWRARRQDPQWGSGGRIYFWIQRKDLAARRFDRIWTILQCT